MGRLHPKAHFLDLSSANGAFAGTTTTTTATLRPFATPASYFADPFRPGTQALHCSLRDEPTRVQLQQERLRDYYGTPLVSTSIPEIPGLKTSAAFFASLRTNLRLHASPSTFPSPISTPNSMRASSAASLPPPSPLSVPVMESDIPGAPAPVDPLAGVPELTSYLAADQIERDDALMLVADSVAQQRNAANRALIYHPLNLMIMVAIMAVFGQTLVNWGYDKSIAAITCFGLCMAGLVSCRMFSQGYIGEAESINWDWAGDADVLVTKFGDEVIGTVLIEWLSGESRKKGKKAWQGFIKGWTVKLRYRGKGVGTALLEDAVKEAKKKGAESLEFAADHANSLRVLPSIYNRAMDDQDRKARGILQDLLESTPARGKKK